MTILGDALHPIQSEGKPGRRGGGKAIDVDILPLAFSHVSFFLSLSSCIITSCLAPPAIVLVLIC